MELNDTELFMNAQEVYLNKTSTKEEKETAWGTMFEKVNKCCEVQMRKWLKKIGQVQDYDRDDMISEAVYKIMSRYIKSIQKGGSYCIKYLVEVCRLATMGEIFYYYRKDRQTRPLMMGVTEFDFQLALTPKERKQHIRVEDDDEENKEEDEDGEYF